MTKRVLYRKSRRPFTEAEERMWHHLTVEANQVVPVEPDRKTIQTVADALEIYEGQDFSEPAARWSAAVDVLAALGIGDNDET